VSKRCSIPMPCRFEDHCKHRQLPAHQSTGSFWPNGAGEACRHYELHTPTPEEVAERMIRLAGAHS
jgi:hypothetical protein